MQTYLELKVPVRNESVWLKDLKSALLGLPVRWQNGHYHITMAFLDQTPSNFDVASIIDKHLSKAEPQMLKFDKIDAFTANNTGMYIINLTTSGVPERFKRLVNDIRDDLKANGCVMNSEFRLHVTLGRLDTSTIDLEKLLKIIRAIKIPVFQMELDSFEYRKFRGESIKVWSH